MTDALQRVERAIRWAPSADRSRYAEEWRHDVATADTTGRTENEVAHAAMRMAVDLRLRHWAGVLLGSAGFWKALSAWVGLLVLAGAAFTLGGPVVLVLVIAIVVTVVAFAWVGAPSHWSHWLVVTSLALGAISGWYVWWVAGVAMDAADSFTPEPPAAAWGGAGVVVFLSSGLLLILAAVIAVRREIRPSAS